MLHELRWRKPPRDHRRLGAALAIALVLHVFFVVAVWYEMKPTVRMGHVTHVQRDEAIQIRFITHNASKPLAAPPPLVTPPLPHAAREPVSKNAMTVHLPSTASTLQPTPATSAPRPALFDRTGRIVLPANASSAPTAPSADYVQHAPQGDTQIMEHRAGAAYQSAPNQLQKYFPPPHESFVGGLMRKLNGSESNTKDVDLPHGIHLKCQKVLGIPIPNCAIPPPPPPPTDGDERLNMAPAPLVKGTPTPKPDIATCIADYQANKPLPYGCPVDTPARAVDAQKRASVPQP